MTIVDKSYVVGKDFNGILKFLRDETGGNIHKNGTVNITDNSLYKGSNESCQTENVADPRSSIFQMPRIESAFFSFEIL